MLEFRMVQVCGHIGCSLVYAGLWFQAMLLVYADSRFRPKGLMVYADSRFLWFHGLRLQVLGQGIGAMQVMALVGQFRSFFYGLGHKVLVYEIAGSGF